MKLRRAKKLEKRSIECLKKFGYDCQDRIMKFPPQYVADRYTMQIKELNVSRAVCHEELTHKSIDLEEMIKQSIKHELSHALEPYIETSSFNDGFQKIFRARLFVGVKPNNQDRENWK